jgi:hypothetical protein
MSHGEKLEACAAGEAPPAGAMTAAAIRTTSSAVVDLATMVDPLES